MKTLPVLGLMLLTAQVRAADLNAPLVDQPTIGSEIKRGWSAAFDCHLNHLRPLGFAHCIDEASSAAEQNHANYKPFELGLFFNYWYLADLRFQSAKALTDNQLAQQEAPE